MLDNYSIEDLEKKFLKDAKQYEQEEFERRAEWTFDMKQKNKYFNIAQAFHVICKEINELKNKN